MLTIAIESSTRRGSVALAQDGNVLENHFFSPGMHHGREIVPTLKRLLDNHEKAVQEVELVAVGIGPGSFTGLRVGISTGLGFAFGRPQCRLLGVASFHGIAERFVREESPDDTWLSVMADARRKRVYHGLYRIEEDRWKQEGDFEVIEADELVRQLPKGCLVVGSGGALLPPGEYRWIEDGTWWAPAAGDLALIADRQARDWSDDFPPVEPIYLVQQVAVKNPRTH